MTLRSLRIPAAFVLVTALLASPALTQTRAAAPASPYGGVTVEDIVARINDRVITSSDYDRALKDLDQEQRQHGASMQETSLAHKDLLRNLIDQQLWLSKGKELGVTGETELINRLNEIRKQYNLSTLEDLEKAAQEQGVSFEDFKANIRNGIVTQTVMRQEVGNRISVTPGEVQRYFEEHKQEYARQESVQLGEILVSTGAADAPDAAQKLAQAQAKADEIEAKLHAGGDFAQLARTFSDGTTASSGGELGTYKRGQLAKVFEDQVFTLKTGEFTAPVRTKQGFIIFKVLSHVPGGVPAYKDVQQDVEQNYFMARMEPAIRDYLTKMREDSYIAIKDGYSDTGASPNKRVLPIAYSAYTPPAPKKKRKVERTRFRETSRGFRQKATPAVITTEKHAAPAPVADSKKKDKKAEASMKPGKKEKIRFGKAPQETLPNSPAAQTEDAGAVPQQQTASAADEPVNPLEAEPERKKTRLSARAREPKQPKKGVVVQKEKEAMTPVAADSGEVADRQTQSSALGLNGDTTKKKKKASATGEKTRLSERAKEPSEKKTEAPLQPTPIPAVKGAPAPSTAPAEQPAAPVPQPDPPSAQPQQ